MTPAQRRRFESSLALSRGGATAGERAAGLAAAERIAASAGLTIAEAKARVRDRSTDRAGAPRPGPTHPRPAYPWAKPKEATKPLTVEELLRQKAETEAWRKRRAAAADRRMAKELAEQAAYEAEQRELQAERDREWAASRTEA